jgi:Major tropism determinant N-terminal domain
MTFRVLLKTGTATQNDGYTGLTGEVTVDTTKSTLRVHDGTKMGGHELALNDLSNISNNTFYTKGIASGLGGGGGGGGGGLGSFNLDGGTPFTQFGTLPSAAFNMGGVI